jgi:hypothetical protein
MPNVSDFIPCSINICQNNGQCLLDNSSIGNLTCLCTKCFTGTFCEMGKYSDNLWYKGISDDKCFKNYRQIEAIVGFLLAVVSFLSNFLVLQTCLCSRKIRITNIGVYLLLLSSSCLMVSFIGAFIGATKLGNTYILFQCAVMRLFVSSLIYCIFLLILCITVERILIEYSFISLYHSRRSSLISNLCFYSIAPMINILVNIYGRKDNYSFIDFCEINFTSTGYMVYSVLRWIIFVIASVAVLICCFFILHHLLQHRRRFTGLLNKTCHFES